MFVDSSVLMAAAISPRGRARDLIMAGLRGEFELVLSRLVLAETERNILAKAPAAHPAFVHFRQALGAAHDPPRALVLRVAAVVEAKDAPIVAGAIQGRARYLASYDRRHLLHQKEQIQVHYGIIVATPDEVLAALGS